MNSQDVRNGILATYVWLGILDKQKAERARIEAGMQKSLSPASMLIPGAIAGGALGSIVDSPFLGTALGASLGAGIDLHNYGGVPENDNPDTGIPSIS